MVELWEGCREGELEYGPWAEKPNAASRMLSEVIKGKFLEFCGEVDHGAVY